jgi:hypothetical protein
VLQGDAVSHPPVAGSLRGSVNSRHVVALFTNDPSVHALLQIVFAFTEKHVAVSVVFDVVGIAEQFGQDRSLRSETIRQPDALTDERSFPRERGVDDCVHCVSPF